MDHVTILAKAVETAGSKAAEEGIVPIDLIWKYITSLNLVEALTFMSFGTVCLFYGWRVFKILVAICFGLFGLLAAIWVNKYLIEGNVIWLSIIFVGLFAFLSTVLMRWGVSFLGGATGGVLGGGAWLAIGFPEQYILAGVIMGAIAGFLISFIVFKIAVMLFTSFAGSALMVVGALAVVYKHMEVAEKLQELVFERRWFLPVLLVVPIAVGMIIQYRFIKGAKDWDI